MTPLCVISNIQNSLVRSVRTYPNIGSWSAVQMKGSKTIQADQIAKNEIFGQIDHSAAQMNGLKTIKADKMVEK